ncbi:MAG: ExbD/TolR family protein [Polyangiales bacterium]
MGMSTGGGSRAPMSEINVTPLVDVMLVLLIIFMVAAPMIKTGVPVDLPNARAPQLEIEEEKLLLTITKDEKVYLGETLVPYARLETALKSNARLQREGEIYVQADEDLRYGFAVKIFGLIREAGIETVGLVTNPLGSE